MREEYKSRQMSLRASGEKDRMDAAMGEIGAYLKEGNTEDRALQTMAEGQGKNYLYHMTQKSALARNARADQRFYTEQVRKASERDDNGRIKNIRDYNRLIKAGAGADAYDGDETIRQNALTTVTADAYDAYEKERAETSKRYSTLFDKQVTKDVLAQYKSALRSTNIDAILASDHTQHHYKKRRADSFFYYSALWHYFTSFSILYSSILSCLSHALCMYVV